MSPSLVAMALLAAAGSGRVRLQVVDAVTGIGIPARAQVAPAGEATGARALPAEGALIDLPSGPVRIEVEADGHHRLAARFVLEEASELPVTFALDPVRMPAAARALRGRALLHGSVVDAATARPVAGARVAVDGLDAGARTGPDGAFRLEVAARGGAAARLALLRISAPGYRTHEVRGLLLEEGATLLQEVLVPGTGLTQRDDTPKVLGGGSAHGEAQSAAPSMEEPAASSAAAASAAGDAALVPLDPPASVRVGTSCTCSTCTAVTVLSLETYVKRGLNDEWIASWNAHALRSGAVAYRSYGAWYVAHPISGTYDICSTTCCQVNDADTHTATDAAATRTAGYMLERAGAVFRSEYSAENNAWDDPGDGLSCSNADLSCGDGAAGSPAAGWPCVADAPDVGHGCFGHGRGACQWGTQRWSSGQGRHWAWILDHYYNDHGQGGGQRTARLSTPVTLQQASAPARVRRGQTFRIDATVLNRAEVAHARILLGASLATRLRVLDDPAHDVLVPLAAGSNAVARDFTVPADAPLMQYHLLVAVYDDVNENGVIDNGTDVPLQVLTVPDAVRVRPALQAAPARVRPPD